MIVVGEERVQSYSIFKRQEATYLMIEAQKDDVTKLLSRSLHVATLPMYLLGNYRYWCAHLTCTQNSTVPPTTYLEGDKKLKCQSFSPV